MASDAMLDGEAAEAEAIRPTQTEEEALHRSPPPQAVRERSTTPATSGVAGSLENEEQNQRTAEDRRGARRASTARLWAAERERMASDATASDKDVLERLQKLQEFFQGLRAQAAGDRPPAPPATPPYQSEGGGGGGDVGSFLTISPQTASSAATPQTAPSASSTQGAARALASRDANP